MTTHTCAHHVPVCNSVTLHTNLDWVSNWENWGFDDAPTGGNYLAPSHTTPCQAPCALLGDFGTQCHTGNDQTFGGALKAAQERLAWECS